MTIIKEFVEKILMVIITFWVILGGFINYNLWINSLIAMACILTAVVVVMIIRHPNEITNRWSER